MKTVVFALLMLFFETKSCCALTTKQLYEACDSGAHSAQRIMCDAYLRGLLTGLRAGQALQNGRQPLCLPSTSPDTARLILKKFIENAPKALDAENDASGDASALLAFIAAYLCPKQN